MLFFLPYFLLVCVLGARKGRDGPRLERLIGDRIVRMSSFRNRISLSGEWRGCDYERDTVVRFLEDMKGIMGAISEE
jgi:hypothetical protein